MRNKSLVLTIRVVRIRYWTVLLLITCQVLLRSSHQALRYSGLRLFKIIYIHVRVKYYNEWQTSTFNRAHEIIFYSKTHIQFESCLPSMFKLSFHKLCKIKNHELIKKIIMFFVLVWYKHKNIEIID